MIILGINAYHGDASAVLVEGGKLVAALEEERLNRTKHSAGIPSKAVREVLDQAGISPEDVDYITTSRNPSANLLAKLQFVFKSRPPISFLKDRFSVAVKSAKLLNELSPSVSSLRARRVFSVGEAISGPEVASSASPPRNNAHIMKAKSIRVEHHLSHAASAFYPSGFERAALLTVDGFGDFSSVIFGIGEGNRIRLLKRILFPHSLGILYTAATQFLGFPHYGDEYKIMGLAAYGRPRFAKEFKQIIHLDPDGGFRLNLDYFTHAKGQLEMSWEKGEPILGPVYSNEWTKLFGSPRLDHEKITGRDQDLAASAQEIFEEAFFHLLRYLHQVTKLKTLCLAGGCAFNSLANGKIFDQTPFEKVYIQPAAGDAGTALGSALYLAHHRLNLPRQFVMDHAYWGSEFSEREIIEELNRRRIVILSEAKDLGSFGPLGLRMTAERIQDETTLCQKAAQALAQEKIVGWFQGKMEWGPRALGNRSLLADPRSPRMKEILNVRIKQREDFRPFAPSVLEERAAEWFEMKTRASPFMNLVFPVRKEKMDKIPAVVHVDGTARVHTVSKRTNPLFWQLINEFEKVSAVPLLLNTSFNENEPIVSTPQNALDCFLRTKIDILVLGPYWVERKAQA